MAASREYQQHMAMDCSEMSEKENYCNSMSPYPAYSTPIQKTSNSSQTVPSFNMIKATPSPVIPTMNESTKYFNCSNFSDDVDGDKTITPADTEEASTPFNLKSIHSHDDSMLSTIVANLTLTQQRRRKKSIDSQQLIETILAEQSSIFKCGENSNSIPNVSQDVEDHDLNQDEDMKRPKRSRSPLPLNTPNYIEPPEKYISVDEHVSHQQKTGKRNILLSTSKVRFSDRKSATGSSSSKFNQATPKIVHDSDHDQNFDKSGLVTHCGVPKLGARLGRRTKARMEPFQLTSYKKEAIFQPSSTASGVKVFKAGGRTHQTVRKSILLPEDKKLTVRSITVPQLTPDGKPTQRCTGHYGVMNPPSSKLTVVKPFSFDTRYKEKKQQQQRAVADGHTSELDTNFRARPPTVLHQKPFVPVKSTKEPTQPITPKLHTRERSQQRDQFEMKLKKIEATQMEELKKRAEAAQKREAEEINRLRRELVHKARPPPQPTCFAVKKSSKPLTEPESPATFSRHLKQHESSSS